MSGHDDKWFQHDDLPSEAHGTLNPYAIGGFLVAVIVATFVVVYLVLGYYQRVVTSQRVVKQERGTPVAEISEAEATWNGELRGEARWLDSEHLRIPVDYATSEVIDEYARRRR